ncbi:unnamed protein product [Closterium sp. Yama58-4]|nr:unnamed protein product [Closterium sp. Yama58-4]
MLNAIHLVHYQRYYHSLLAKLAPSASATLLPDDPASAGAGSDNAGSAEAVGSGGGSIEDLLESMDRLAPRRQVRVARKPRMLVCAPSNAAVDKLLLRVLLKGLLVGEMRTYRPDVARVGAEAATPAAQAVSVERRSQQLLQVSAEEAAHHVAALRHKEGQLACHVSVLQRQIRELVEAGGGGSGEGGSAVGMDPEVLVQRERERDALVQRLAVSAASVAMVVSDSKEGVEEREQVGVEVGRLLIVLGARRGDVTLEAARAQLEASFAEEAEVVFTTASSSGRR